MFSPDREDVKALATVGGREFSREQRHDENVKVWIPQGLCSWQTLAEFTKIE